MDGVSSLLLPDTIPPFNAHILDKDMKLITTERVKYLGSNKYAVSLPGLIKGFGTQFIHIYFPFSYQAFHIDKRLVRRNGFLEPLTIVFHASLHRSKNGNRLAFGNDELPATINPVKGDFSIHINLKSNKVELKNKDRKMSLEEDIYL
jgi:hypothetical protein